MDGRESIMIHSKANQFQNLIKKHKVYLAFMLLSLLLMLFCTKSSPLFAFNDWFDANVYFTMGKGMMNGRVPYQGLRIFLQDF